MDRFSQPRRAGLPGRLGSTLAALASFLLSPAHADQIEQHNALVSRFIVEDAADPVAADCAAHADFVVGTSAWFDHVDFTRSTFDDAHASIVPWNGPFDQAKQRVQVDTVVRIKGLGIYRDSQRTPAELGFRCGYLDNKMLAFSWNDPVPPNRVHSTAHGIRAKKGRSRGAARTHKRAKRHK